MLKNFKGKFGKFGYPVEKLFGIYFSIEKEFNSDFFQPSMKPKPVLLFCFNKTSCLDDETQLPVRNSNITLNLFENLSLP